MAEKTIPSSIAQGKPFPSENPVAVDFLADGTTPVVSSLALAEHFGIKHQHVLRDIRAIQRKVPETFNESNFGPGEYVDTKGEKRPAYHLTRDAFTLLAMGYNSPRAIQWKLKYIAEFKSENSYTAN